MVKRSLRWSVDPVRGCRLMIATDYYGPSRCSWRCAAYASYDADQLAEVVCV